MPKFRLSQIKLDEISLVPAGDDPSAKVVIAKAAMGEDVSDHGGGANLEDDLKISQADANYGQAGDGEEVWVRQRCGNCVFFNKAESSCDVVAGEIAEDMVSDLFWEKQWDQNIGKMRTKTGWGRFQPGRKDPARYKVPNPKSSPKEIAGSHGHRPHGKSILWPALYEHLRRKGYSKEKAARISNAAWKKKRMGMKTNTPTSVRGLVKSDEGREQLAGKLKDWLEKVMKEMPPDDETLAELEDGEEDKSEDDTDDTDNVEDDSSEGEDDDMPEVKKADLPPEVVQYIDALEAKVDELTKARKPDPKADVLAKADPEIRALIEKQEARIKEAEEIAKAEREARLEREYIAKAEQLRMVNENPAELATLLRTLADKAPDEAKKVEELLKAADAQIAKGNLFSEFGVGGAETTIAKSVESAAQEIMKSDPNMTREQAIARVYEQNPDLYAEAMKEG